MIQKSTGNCENENNIKPGTIPTVSPRYSDTCAGLCTWDLVDIGQLQMMLLAIILFGSTEWSMWGFLASKGTCANMKEHLVFFSLEDSSNQRSERMFVFALNFMSGRQGTSLSAFSSLGTPIVIDATTRTSSQLRDAAFEVR